MLMCLSFTIKSLLWVNIWLHTPFPDFATLLLRRANAEEKVKSCFHKTKFEFFFFCDSSDLKDFGLLCIVMSCKIYCWSFTLADHQFVLRIVESFTVLRIVKSFTGRPSVCAENSWADLSALEKLLSNSLSVALSPGLSHT